MSRPKKIAVLVHNDVVRDARVRKQARSLVEAGHEVEVFGFSTASNDYPTIIEGGARLKITSVRSMNLFMKISLALVKLITGNLTAKLLLTLLVMTGLNTLILGAVVGSLNAQWVFVLSLTLICLFFLLILLGGVTFIFFRSYIDAWIAVNWKYDAIARSLASNVIGESYDAVHCHDIIAMIAGAIVKKTEPSIKMVWDAHELYTDINYPNKFMGLHIGKKIRKIAPVVDSMITISQSFVEIYAERFPDLPSAEVVMNATRRPLKNDLNRSLLRNAAKVSDKQKVLLFQGGFGPHRGIEMLLDAATKLPANWSVVFMGYGPLQGQIEAAAKSANIERKDGAQCIILVDAAPQEVLRDWTSGADLGIIPYENSSNNHLFCTPNKLWEYPNARVPILATDLIEMNQIITANGTGVLLPREFTAEDIVNAISGISDSQLEEWRSNCDTFNSSENWEKFEPNLLKVYA